MGWSRDVGLQWDRTKQREKSHLSGSLLGICVVQSAQEDLAKPEPFLANVPLSKSSLCSTQEHVCKSYFTSCQAVLQGWRSKASHWSLNLYVPVAFYNACSSGACVLMWNIVWETMFKQRWHLYLLDTKDADMSFLISASDAWCFVLSQKPVIPRHSYLEINTILFEETG